MLPAGAFRQVAAEQGISILDLGNNTDFQKEIEQTGFQQNHHIAFYGGSDASNYRVSLGYVDRQGVILNEDMKNFTSNMNMTQKIFGDFIRCELGMFGSVQKITIFSIIRRLFIRQLPLILLFRIIRIWRRVPGIKSPMPAR